jgi:hypothetical protein
MSSSPRDVHRQIRRQQMLRKALVPGAVIATVLTLCAIEALPLAKPPKSLIVLAVVALWAFFPVYLQRSGRRRFAEITRALAEKGRTEIEGRTAEDWMNILNRDAAATITAAETMVLVYKQREWFFVDGQIGHTLAYAGKGATNTQHAFFLLAVDESAVSLLAEEGAIFRHLVGSKDLAAYSIYHWSAFLCLVAAERAQ